MSVIYICRDLADVHITGVYNKKIHVGYHMYINCQKDSTELLAHMALLYITSPAAH